MKEISQAKVFMKILANTKGFDGEFKHVDLRAITMSGRGTFCTEVLRRKNLESFWIYEKNTICLIAVGSFCIRRRGNNDEAEAKVGSSTALKTMNARILF